MFDRETRREKILDGRLREMKLKEKTGSNKVFSCRIVESRKPIMK